jgi:hypothetical protein
MSIKSSGSILDSSSDETGFLVKVGRIVRLMQVKLGFLPAASKEDIAQLSKHVSTVDSENAIFAGTVYAKQQEDGTMKEISRQEYYKSS